MAVGYRRKQLDRFEKLLSDPEFFSSELEQLNCKPEAMWQRFFEANTWIFGYGLAYQFLSNLDGKALEQFVRGRDLRAADLTPDFHPSGTRDRGWLSRRSAGEATTGVWSDRCWLSPAANAAGVA